MRAHWEPARYDLPRTIGWTQSGVATNTSKTGTSIDTLYLRHSARSHPMDQPTSVIEPARVAEVRDAINAMPQHLSLTRYHTIKPGQPHLMFLLPSSS